MSKPNFGDKLREIEAENERAARIIAADPERFPVGSLAQEWAERVVAKGDNVCSRHC